MNTLSWLLYLASVSDKLGNLFSILAVVSIIAFIFWCIVGACAASEYAEEAFWRGWRKVGLWLVPIFFVSFILNAVIPPKETVYAIAASEVGEQAIRSPLGVKTTKALEAWLDRQTNPPAVPK